MKLDVGSLSQPYTKQHIQMNQTTFNEFGICILLKDYN
jgi:hypothetical protein